MQIIYLHRVLFLLAAVIGSANIGQRSFTSDPEIGVAVVDEETVKRPSDKLEVAKFAFETRVKCWGEQANMAPEKINKMSIKEGIEALKGAKSIVEDKAELKVKKGAAIGLTGSMLKEMCDLR